MHEQEPDFDAASIGAALAELAERVKTSYENNDADMYASAFSDDAIVSVAGKPPLRGLEALKAAFNSRPPLPPGATFDVDLTELEIINGDWAYGFGTDTFTIPSDGDEPPVVETMTFMVLIRRTPDGWKTFREVISADQ